MRGACRGGSPGRQSPQGTTAGQAGPRSHPRAGATLPPGPPDPGPPGRPSDFTLGSSLLVNVSHQLIRKIVSGARLAARCAVPIRSRSLGPTVQLLRLLKFLVSVAGALLDLRDAYQPADSEGGFRTGESGLGWGPLLRELPRRGSRPLASGCPPPTGQPPPHLRLRPAPSRLLGPTRGVTEAPAPYLPRRSPGTSG